MLGAILENTVLLRLQRAAGRPWLPALVGVLACALTATMTVPVTSALIPAVLLSPRRWRAIALQAACGSALGATFLVWLFHDLGWEQLRLLHPGLLEAPGWQRVVDWMGEYGIVALFAVAALPLPQTPALVFCAIAALPAAHVFLAILGGKILKYGVVAALAAQFPARFRVYVDRLEGRGGGAPPRGRG